MRRPMVIFYCLIIYAIFQLIWWGRLLLIANPNSKGMVLGETAVFLFIFFVGAYYLQKAIDQERKLHHRQKNFLLSVTHELKSPLASIKLYLQTILKRELDPAQQKSFLTNSLKDIERLDDLVENMLLATKIESNLYTFPKESFNLSELVNSVAGRLQVHTCSSQIIKLSVQQGIMLEGDKFALTSVVTNLIENAVKYSPPCAEVNVSLKRSNGQIQFIVADSGIGINDQEKSRIFEKFYRVGSEDTRKTKGTGLGLFIVKQVLDKHQASIKVKNNQPSGTIFEVTFNANAN
ncbi:MAG: two-component sensor histidine kinase [Sphingobacteriales bacterium 17-39-43]|uniref:sensor histidine kinase n=1 Tax=Daejeonella sp. TaxID=2805397 RepID=UPI000BD3728F|nr:HAMP domain-containing sensor histidine kinase [Daejeonella sp.]OYY06124.1 MAG: two-component sensor histidine kinase [Sphingobacteriia bacterium 35-40-5]OYZ29421.1 MAG: two-component sensor histidine kinase [Sphingobacteriales bacterium 16-39-50]OYZ59261.1 MAG: two-component sensor histidine kinase [Sphingobacteriales bacterium 24-40-4]OZA22512.1 MAG: two-component sensor histidine kinase [Sphingobacteriales bacterium 17-39-43]OZA62116.1 MAG: two-component sensor histidine kinase [Sphingob